jgi:hypothetical protein
MRVGTRGREHFPVRARVAMADRDPRPAAWGRRTESASASAASRSCANTRNVSHRAKRGGPSDTSDCQNSTDAIVNRLSHEGKYLALGSRACRRREGLGKGLEGGVRSAAGHLADIMIESVRSAQAILTPGWMVADAGRRTIAKRRDRRGGNAPARSGRWW